MIAGWQADGAIIREGYKGEAIDNVWRDQGGGVSWAFRGERERWRWRRRRGRGREMESQREGDREVGFRSVGGHIGQLNPCPHRRLLSPLLGLSSRAAGGIVAGVGPWLREVWLERARGTSGKKRRLREGDQGWGSKKSGRAAVLAGSVSAAPAWNGRYVPQQWTAQRLVQAAASSSFGGVAVVRGYRWGCQPMLWGPSSNEIRRFDRHESIVGWWSGMARGCPLHAPPGRQVQRSGLFHSFQLPSHPIPSHPGHPTIVQPSSNHPRASRPVFHLYTSPISHPSVP